MGGRTRRGGETGFPPRLAGRESESSTGSSQAAGTVARSGRSFRVATRVAGPREPQLESVDSREVAVKPFIVLLLLFACFAQAIAAQSVSFDPQPTLVLEVAPAEVDARPVPVQGTVTGTVTVIALSMRSR